MSDNTDKPVEITVSKAAAESNILRIWLHRVPEFSGTVYAFRDGARGAERAYIAKAEIFGRGIGSSASQRTMLLFRLNPDEKSTSMREGDILRLQVKIHDDDGYKDIDLDIMSVE